MSHTSRESDGDEQTDQNHPFAVEQESASDGTGDENENGPGHPFAIEQAQANERDAEKITRDDSLAVHESGDIRENIHARSDKNSEYEPEQQQISESEQNSSDRSSDQYDDAYDADELSSRPSRHTGERKSVRFSVEIADTCHVSDWSESSESIYQESSHVTLPVEKYSNVYLLFFLHIFIIFILNQIFYSIIISFNYYYV